MADVKLVALVPLVNKGDLIAEGAEFEVDPDSAEALLDDEQEGGALAAKPSSKAAKSAAKD